MGNTLNTLSYEIEDNDKKYKIYDIITRHDRSEFTDISHNQDIWNKTFHFINYISIDDLIGKFLNNYNACYYLNQISFVIDSNESFAERIKLVASLSSSNRRRRSPADKILYNKLLKVKKEYHNHKYIIHDVLLSPDIEPCIGQHRYNEINKSSERILNAIKTCKKRFIYMDIAMYPCYERSIGHMNLIIIDNEKKIIYYFEPAIDDRQIHNLYDSLHIYFKPLKSYKVIYSKDVIGIDFPSALQSLTPDDKNCEMWSKYYGILRILNPDLPDRVIIKYLGGSDSSRAYYMINNFVWFIYFMNYNAINNFYNRIKFTNK